MTEAPSFAPEKTCGFKPKNNHLNHANIPVELINPAPSLSESRGKFVENRVKNIITLQTDIVETVIRNKPNGSEDTQGHDLTVILKGDTPIRTVYVQVKSRKEAITEYKRKIRNKYFSNKENGPELVKRWLTEHGIILINGSEVKTDEQILTDSFYPQLKRIQKDTKRKQNTEASNQMNLFTDNSLTQIFPSYVTDEKSSLREHPLDNFKTQEEKEEKTQTNNGLLIRVLPVFTTNEQITLQPFS